MTYADEVTFDVDLGNGMSHIDHLVRPAGIADWAWAQLVDYHAEYLAEWEQTRLWGEAKPKEPRLSGAMM